MPQPMHSGPEGAPEWMVSYADMITIMMAFFVVMYASAGTASSGSQRGEKTGQGANPVVDARGAAGDGTEGIAGRSDNPQVDRVMESLYWRFGPEWTIRNCWVGGPPQLRGATVGNVARATGNKDKGSRAYGRIGEDPTPARGPKPSGNVLAGGRIFFDEFSAELSPAQQERLRRLAEDMAGKVQKFELRGHTSRRPLPAGATYRDHWDLAYDRCRAVRDFLVAQGIDPRRIRLGVAGENEPLDSDAEPVPAGQNSRVDIHGLNEYLPGPAGVGKDEG